MKMATNVVKLVKIEVWRTKKENEGNEVSQI